MIFDSITIAPVLLVLIFFASRVKLCCVFFQKKRLESSTDFKQPPFLGRELCGYCRGELARVPDFFRLFFQSSSQDSKDG